ncbi:MAG: TatD family hydrolase [Burkholderiales bacterium]|nr:TatD family hydrolase [Burkholderiales bacterium]
MFIDSHCHLSFPELKQNLAGILADMRTAQVEQAICICTQMEEFEAYRLNGRSIDDMEWQRERFRTHIRAAKQAAKPLVIHTRSSAADTLRVLDEEGGEVAGGVFHCFTETAEVALAAVERGYYISFSGIVSFKNAQDLRDLLKLLPLARVLIETDSPYLAPVPFRGKTNSPAYVPHVAKAVADAVGLPVPELAAITTANTRRLFSLPETVA